MYKLLLALLCCVSTACFSQSIHGIVQDEYGVRLKGVTILLYSGTDTTPQKFTVSNENGQFDFHAAPLHSYRVCASHVGYRKSCATVSLETTEEVQLDLILAKETAALATVTVTSRRPLIEVRSDKLIINVEGSINTVGTTALEVLRRAPGVSLDNDDNISLSGKSGVQVYIDGRQSPLSGADLAGYLSSLQASQLDAVEIMTNPSAKYEAAGNAGFINIRLKKNKAIGTNGTVNVGYGIGYSPKYNAGISINHRNKRFNIFGSYNFTDSYNYTYTRTDRYLGDSSFKSSSRRVVNDRPHNIQVGTDLFITPKATIGFLVNVLPGQTTFDNKTRTYIQQKNSTEPNRLLVATQRDERQKTNNSFNLNYRYATPEKEWNVDADYARYTAAASQWQPNDYYDKANNFLYNRNYRIPTESDINVYSLKFNYDFSAWKGKWSLGGKYSNLSSDNAVTRFTVLPDAEKYDSLRSNSFGYKETINALFARYTKAFKSVTLQAGLRLEDTHIQGLSQGYQYANGYKPYDSSFRRHYTDLFPSASISFKKIHQSQFSLNFGRRIDRPPYADINPFEYKVDDYLSRRGNTALRPQYTNIVELSHVYKEKLTTVVSYSHVQNAFTQIFDTTEVSKTFITKTNVATQDVYSLSMNYVFMKKRLSGFINFNPFYSNYRSNFGANRNLHLEAFSYSVKAQSGYKFNHGWAAELSGSYTSAGIGLGFFKGRPFGTIDAAVAKTALKDKLSVKAAVSDLFFTNKIIAKSLFAGQYMEVERSYEPRVFRVNISYKFGSNTVKAARQRKTLIDEENKRLQISN